MKSFLLSMAMGLAGVLVVASSAPAQRPYIGFVYPAGAQQGTTVQVRIGGQRLVDVSDVVVSGSGVSAKVVKYYRQLGNQDAVLLREQARLLRTHVARQAKVKGKKKSSPGTQAMITRIEKRLGQWVRRPAVAAHSDLTFVEVTVDPDAAPGPREIRLVAARGLTNPLVFHVGQVPEVARKPMKICSLQVLGKEHLSQRKRPAEEEEEHVTTPCTMNGQIASGEVNRYRFKANKGQRLVISTHARDLIPYIADAVPGWFQPVLTLRDADGKEVAYNDDFRFKPDPTLYYEVPQDGEYVLAIRDALYRGREDFVYRVTIGEMPFVTSVFPLGGRAGKPVSVAIDGWNLKNAQWTPPSKVAGRGTYFIPASSDGVLSNRVPFALDNLPECLEKESNDDPKNAQEITMPMIVNGRADRPGDWDVFAVKGRAGETVVAEVQARRLDSPIDSMLKITDASGKLLAMNDDHSDPGSGLNTHHADSYLMFTLPKDGTYYIHIGETTRAGGKEYAYRLRISAPRPDFELRVTPSGGGMRSKGGAQVNVYAIRRDGFDGEIQLSLKDPPEGFRSWNIKLPAAKSMVKFFVKTSLSVTQKPVTLTIEGRATIGQRKVVHDAVPAEDRMQAFLWRHLVPAQDMAVVVFNQASQSSSKRVAPELTEEERARLVPADSAAKPQFTQRQVANQLRRLKWLYQEWLLTDYFYKRKVAELQTTL